LHQHARDALHFRWPWLLSLPVLIAAFGYGQRGLRALIDPASVAASMTTHSALNVGSAFAYVVLALAFHAMLTVLVVARLLAQLHRLSHRDGLTGLLNRRAMQEALDEQMRRSRRNGEAFVLMMLDADHFKAINDQHGHAVGDLVLKHLSTLLHGGMREVDRLARFGGEEFLVLLPGLTLAEAHPVAERLRALVAGTPLTEAGASIPVSVSIGIAEWGGAHEDLSRLLVRADAALYQAKQHGRDRVALAEAPSPALAAG
jgi:diguanylate cyclase (GGDEF)-like protein